MHKLLILVGSLGRAPAEPHDKPSIQKKAPTSTNETGANTAEAATLWNNLHNDIAVDESGAAGFPIDCKALCTLSAQYALAGFELSAETGIDGAPRLFAVCRGTGQHIDIIDAARAHLDSQIGGPS